jgi:hypothetical protein
MSKKVDLDVQVVKRCVEALLAQDPNKRRITLEYLWSRFVVDPAVRDTAVREQS